MRVDPRLLPAVSFDQDVPQAHKRRADGYLEAKSPELRQFGVAAPPVSILKTRFIGAQYDQFSTVVSVEQFKKMLQNID